LARGRGTAAKHSTTNPKIVGSNPTTEKGEKERISKKIFHSSSDTTTILVKTLLIMTLLVTFTNETKQNNFY
jgi:hypothetical protein